MKTKHFLFTKSLLPLLLLAFSSALFAQETAEKTADFTWEITVDKNRILIKCQEGCTYQNLAFSANRTVTLNQSGMVALEKNPSEESASDFLIAYTKKGEKITLTGIKGVSWTELTLTAGKAVYRVDENGISTN